MTCDWVQCYAPLSVSRRWGGPARADNYHHSTNLSSTSRQNKVPIRVTPLAFLTSMVVQSRGRRFSGKGGKGMVVITGRQPPPLSSVLYGIISKRRSVVAAQLLLREKLGVWRVATDSNIPSLPGGSMKFIWWKLTSQLSRVFLPILGPLLVQGFILERGPTIFKLFKNTICKGVCTVKCTEKRSTLLPPFIFSLNLSPIKNLKEALNMSTGMYCKIHLLEIMRLSAFKSPLSYPSS